MASKLPTSVQGSGQVGDGNIVINDGPSNVKKTLPTHDVLILLINLDGTAFANLHPMTHAVRITQSALIFATLILCSFFFAMGIGQLASIPLLSIETPALSPLPIQEEKTEVFQPKNADAICDLNVFNSAKRSCRSSDTGIEVSEKIDDSSGVICQTNDKLIATFATNEKESSFAMIRAQNNSQFLFVGTTIPELGTVQEIGWSAVLFEGNNSNSCILSLFDSPEETKIQKKARQPGKIANHYKNLITSISPTSYRVKRELIQPIFGGNIPKGIGRSRATPHIQEGKIAGFKLMRIRPNSLPGALGFRNGDILTSVNNIELTSYDKILGNISSFQKASQYSIKVKRGGKILTLTYDVE